jgi:hypothetical protein
LKDGKRAWEWTSKTTVSSNIYLTSHGLLVPCTPKLIMLDDKGEVEWESEEDYLSPDLLCVSDDYAFVLGRGEAGTAIKPVKLKDGKEKKGSEFQQLFPGHYTPMGKRLVSVPAMQMGTLAIVDPFKGKMKTAEGEVMSSNFAAVADDAIFLTAGRNLREFNDDLEQVQNAELPEELNSQPIVTDDVVIVASLDTTYILSRDGLKLLQTIKKGGMPALAGGALFTFERLEEGEYRDPNEITYTGPMKVHCHTLLRPK